MLVRILGRHNLSAIEYSIRYILNEGKAISEDGELVQPILQNLRSDSTDIKGLAHEIISNEANRKITSNRLYMFHEILSFGSGDKSAITPEMVQEITLKYLQLRGDDLVAIAIPHFNTDSVHTHIISGSTRYRESKSSGLRKAELLSIKNQLELYVLENYPQLEYSSIRHGQSKEYLSEKEYQARQNGRSTKQELKELVSSIYMSSKNKTEFIQKLNTKGYLTYERNQDGQITGIVSASGRKHRFSTLGISAEQIQGLETVQELTREEKLLHRLQNINNKQQNEKDLERD